MRPVALRARARSRIRRRRLPVQQPPLPAERTMRAELLAMVQLAEQLVMQRIGPALERLEREQEAARRDEALPDVARLIMQARVEYERTITVTRMERVAAKAGEQLDLFNRAQVTRQIQAVLPLDVQAAFGSTAAEIADFTREGVDLIQSMSSDYFDEIEAIVSDGFASGRRSTSIAKDINRRGEVSESRARFIARDQCAKLNGKLTQKRQEDLGVAQYIWRTSGDSRTRESHRELDGQTFRWDDPPVVDEHTGRRAHPGEDYQCRCRAEPDLDALLEELEASEDLPPVPAQAEAVLPEAARPLVDLERILPAVPLPALPGQRAPTWAGLGRRRGRPRTRR